MRKQSAESPVMHSVTKPAADFGEDAPHPKGADLTVMHYTNYQPTPVYSSDGFRLMPCHPARARKLLHNGRAVPHHIRGIFGIRLPDRTRTQSEVLDAALRIDPGSITTGIAVTTDDDDNQRTVLAAVEAKHHAFTKATMTKRRRHSRNRRGRLRYRAPLFDNRHRKSGTLPPSVDSLRADTMRVVRTMLKMYPITRISIERNKFDPQLMMNPDIKGVEYQQGTLFGWQVRAYILDATKAVACIAGVAKRDWNSTTRTRAPSAPTGWTTSSPAAATATSPRAISPSSYSSPTSQNCWQTSSKGCNAPTWLTPPMSTQHCPPSYATC